MKQKATLNTARGQIESALAMLVDDGFTQDEIMDAIREAVDALAKQREAAGSEYARFELDSVYVRLAREKRAWDALDEYE